ncbi:MAG: isoprenylcysteine carboxylmethyltransferase family protein [Rhizobiaceae bacterium]
MTNYQDKPNSFPWPPVIYGIAILASAFSGYVLPLPWPGSPFSDFLFMIGLAMIASALFIDFHAMRTMHRHKTTIMPNKGADHLVSTGPFAFSRNPIYLANTMLTVGAGLMSGIFWFLPLALIAAMMTEQLAIKREEAHLSAKFPKAWRDYARKVRRWL